MLSRRVFCASLMSGVTFGPSPTLAARGVSQTEVSLLDVGGRPGTTEDAEAWVSQALLRLPRRGGCVLRIPPGIWRFTRSSGVAIRISDYEDIRIVATGATLIFRDLAQAFFFENCTRVSFDGGVITLDRPPFCVAEVSRALDGGQTLILATKTCDMKNRKIEAVTSIDPGSGLVIPGIDSYGEIKYKNLKEHGSLEIDLNNRSGLSDGQSLILRNAVYEAPILHFMLSRNIRIQDVRIERGAGMGVVFDFCRDISVHRLKIEPPPGERQLMTTTADGIHVNGSSGTVVIRDCELTLMGDDCINIHGRYYRIVSRPDECSLIVMGENARFSSTATSPTQDVFQFGSQMNYGGIGQGQVVSTRIQGRRIRLVFSQPLPQDLTVGDYVYDSEVETHSVIENCIFPGNRARGILAHSDVKIQHCSFSGQFEEAICLGVEPAGLEGPASKGVEILNCSFTNICRRMPTGAIRINGRILKEDGQTVGVGINEDISIIDNNFEDLRCPALFAQAVVRLQFLENTVTGKHTPTIHLTNCEKVSVFGNAFGGSAELVTNHQAAHEIKAQSDLVIRSYN